MELINIYDNNKAITKNIVCRKSTIIYQLLDALLMNWSGIHLFIALLHLWHLHTKQDRPIRHHVRFCQIVELWNCYWDVLRSRRTQNTFVTFHFRSRAQIADDTSKSRII